MHQEISDDRQQIIDLSLETLNLYLSNSVSCRLLANVPVIKQLACAHISQFSILQSPKQVKSLGQLYRVLTSLWLTEDYILNFHQYLN